MSRNNKKRRPQAKPVTSSSSADRYEKYLPEWMRGNGGAPVRPPRPRRARAARPAGGYTPGKLATGDSFGPLG
jgi:hypothetical protein